MALTQRVKLAETRILPSMSITDLVLNTLSENKAQDIVSINLMGKSPLADNMVIASGRSARQLHALAEKLVLGLKTGFGITTKYEGKRSDDWVLIDAGEIIIHLFRPEIREFYQLEKLWAPEGATHLTQT